jgi:2'-5' RNA ligase
METIRAFIAVEIDQPNKQKILDLISDLKKSEADVKWVTQDQMHLTLKFLGNIDKIKIPEITDAMRSSAQDLTSFTITFSKIGAFPNLNHPRVIWIGIDKGAENLKTITEKIETGLEKLGFKREGREFKPHLTLGRVRTSKNMPELTKLIKEANFSSEGEIQISELILFQSTLTQKGAIYTKIGTAALKL